MANRYQPQDYDAFRTPISKCSGKETAFIIWLNREGKNRFLREVGERYNARRYEHTQIIDRYWKGLDEKSRAEYKAIEKSEYNSKENVEARKKIKELNRRTNAHKNAILEYEAKTQHRENIRREQQEKLKENGPIFVAPKTRISDANTILKTDFLAYCSQQRKSIEEVYRLRFFNLSKMNFSTFYNEPMIFVSVSTAAQFIEPETVQLLCYPLELTVVLFTLGEGIQTKRTINMDFAPEVLLSRLDLPTKDYKDFPSMKKEISRLAQDLALPARKFNEGREAIKQAWYDFKEVLPLEGTNCNARLLCEKRCFNQVKTILKQISHEAGIQEWSIVVENFDKKMVPIDEFAMGLAAAAGGNIPEQQIVNHFETNYYLTNRENVCSNHAKIDSGDRFYCQQAMALTNIYKLMLFLRENELYNFREIFCDHIHNFCKLSKCQDENFPRNFEDLILSFNPEIHKNRLKDFSLVPSITENDPEVDILQITNMLRVFKNDQSRQKNNILEDEDSQSDEFNSNHFEHGISSPRFSNNRFDHPDDSDDELPPPRLKPVEESSPEEKEKKNWEKVPSPSFGRKSSPSSSPPLRENFLQSSNHDDRNFDRDYQSQSRSPPPPNNYRENNSHEIRRASPPRRAYRDENPHSSYSDRGYQRKRENSPHRPTQSEPDISVFEDYLMRRDKRLLESFCVERSSPINKDSQHSRVNFVVVGKEREIADKFLPGPHFNPFY